MTKQEIEQELDDTKADSKRFKDLLDAAVKSMSIKTNGNF